MKCGRRCDGEYREVIEPQTFKVRGREVTVSVSLLKCDACGDVMYSPEQVDRAQNAVLAGIRPRVQAIRRTLGRRSRSAP